MKLWSVSFSEKRGVNSNYKHLQLFFSFAVFSLRAGTLNTANSVNTHYKKRLLFFDCQENGREPWKEFNIFLRHSVTETNLINGQSFEFVLFQINLDLVMEQKGAFDSNWFNRKIKIRRIYHQKKKAVAVEGKESWRFWGIHSSNWHDIRAPNYISLFTVYIADIPMQLSSI